MASNNWQNNNDTSEDFDLIPQSVQPFLTALLAGIVIFLWFFVFLPTDSKKFTEKRQEEDELHKKAFQKLEFKGVAFRKRMMRGGHAILTLQDSKNDTFEVYIKSKASYHVYDDVELGDTIEKLPDTLLTIISNYPKRLVR